MTQLPSQPSERCSEVGWSSTWGGSLPFCGTEKSLTNCSHVDLKNENFWVERDLEKRSGLLQNGIRFIKCDLEREAVLDLYLLFFPLPFFK